MTDNEIRIAIAEKCGWGPYKLVDGHYITDYNEEPTCPDYPNDLNAMMSAISDNWNGEFVLRMESKNVWYVEFNKAGKCITRASGNTPSKAAATGFLINEGLWKD